MSTIRVQPAWRRRQEFAVWATAQAPKIRTVAPNTFAVPADLFAGAPEEILIGSLVDGHRYISPAEDEQQEAAEPAWQPPVLPEQEAVPGEPLPPVPESAYGPDSVPLDPPEFVPGGWGPVAEDAPTGDEDQVVLDDTEGSDSSDRETEEAAGDSSHQCGDCGSPFKSERGLATHRRQKHPEGA